MKHFKMLIAILTAYSNYYTMNYFALQSLANAYLKRKDRQAGTNRVISRCLVFDSKYKPFYSDLNSSLAAKLSEVLDVDSAYSEMRIKRIITNVQIDDEPEYNQDILTHEYVVIILAKTTSLDYFIFEIELKDGL
jgi:hypothetical protein